MRISYWEEPCLPWMGVSCPPCLERMEREGFRSEAEEREDKEAGQGTPEATGGSGPERRAGGKGWGRVAITRPGEAD